MMARRSERVGVVLFQLGGPDSLMAVEPFLYNLFCDPDIIDFPLSRIGRRPLAKLISRTRAKKAARHYAAIGGCSPIRKFTEQQARALQARLIADGLDAVCVVAMRYWYPFTADAIAALRQAGVDSTVLVPLYPQYSRTTTGSSLNEWRRQWCEALPTFCVHNFYRNPLYLESVVEKVNEALTSFPDPSRAELVFSAHSVPVSVIENGDPYQREIEDTTALLMQRGAWANPHRLCYQSKVGASRWLQPSLRATLRQLAAEGRCDVCVVPISFVSDHVETLEEIDHCAREEARSFGIERFVMTQGLNSSPTFIRALADSVLTAMAETRQAQHQGGELAALATAAD
jgi:protoporphyrin/coproporphyrin ferrochelatase